MTKSYEELLTDMTEIIAKIHDKGYDKGYQQGKFDAEMEAKITKPALEFLEESRLETAQENRDRIVERAKEEPDSLTTYINARNYKGIAYRLKTEYQLTKYADFRRDAVCHVDFIVNKEKRTVLALMRGVQSRKVYAKGIAKCAPNDCFNVHIGKAIALRRALGLIIPKEYQNAPHPTEVRVGDMIRMKYYNPDGSRPNKYYERNITGIDDVKVRYDNGGFDYLETVEVEAKIIDDSREGVAK